MISAATPSPTTSAPRRAATTIARPPMNIQPTADTGGGWEVDSLRAGEWINYSLDKLAYGSTSVAVRVSSAVATSKFHFEVVTSIVQDYPRIVTTQPITGTICRAEHRRWSLDDGDGAHQPGPEPGRTDPPAGRGHRRLQHQLVLGDAHACRRGDHDAHVQGHRGQLVRLPGRDELQRLSQHDVRRRRHDALQDGRPPTTPSSTRR